MPFLVVFALSVLPAYIRRSPEILVLHFILPTSEFVCFVVPLSLTSPGENVFLPVPAHLEVTLHGLLLGVLLWSFGFFTHKKTKLKVFPQPDS